MKSESILEDGLVRLEKHMAHLGLASRREAKDMIRNGAVMVNKKVVTEPGFGINPDTDKIELKQEKLEEKETYLVYKPRGIETSKTSWESDDLYDVFPKLNHLFPIGRLDKDSEGLILMSNDGVLTKALTGQNSKIGKKYFVVVRETITDEMMNAMSDGIILEGIRTKPAIAEKASRNTFFITLFEGRKHQIRRMCEECHLNVVSLRRVGIGHLEAPDLKEGECTKLEKKDVELLKE